MCVLETVSAPPCVCFSSADGEVDRAPKPRPGSGGCGELIPKGTAGPRGTPTGDRTPSLSRSRQDVLTFGFGLVSHRHENKAGFRHARHEPHQLHSSSQNTKLAEMFSRPSLRSSRTFPFVLRPGPAALGLPGTVAGTGPQHKYL